MLGIRLSHFHSRCPPSFLKVNDTPLLAALEVATGQPIISPLEPSQGLSVSRLPGFWLPLAFTDITEPPKVCFLWLPFGPVLWGSFWNSSALKSSQMEVLPPRGPAHATGEHVVAPKSKYCTFLSSSNNIPGLLCYIIKDIFYFIWTLASWLNFNNTHGYFLSIKGEDLRSDY